MNFMKYSWRIARAFACAVFVLLVAAPETTYGGRVPRKWTYSDLYDASDIVVIGRLSSFEPIDEKELATAKEPPWQNAEGDAGEVFRKHIVAEDATVLVQLSVKGGVEDKELHVLVYGYKNENPGILNGPRFPARRLAEEPVSLLLFLRRGPGRLFVATTGQFDPVDSFQVLMPAEDWENMMRFEATFRQPPHPPRESPESAMRRWEKLGEEVRAKQKGESQKKGLTIPKR